MERVNEDNLKKFVCGVFINSVRIQDAQSPTEVPSSLLGNELQVSSKHQLVNTMMDRLAVGRNLRNRAFAATTAHRNPAHDIALLGLVSQNARFILWVGGGGACGAQREGGTGKQRKHPEKEAHHVGLLLPP